jgi:para-aminobenzoate synthetase component 1
MNGRNSFTFSIDNPTDFKKSFLSYFKEEEYLFYLESNDNNASHSSFSSLAAVGCLDQLTCKTGTAFLQLDRFQQEQQDWMFGFLGYDLKNELENLRSKNSDAAEFPDLHFVVPQHVFTFTDNSVDVHTHLEEESVDELISQIKKHLANSSTATVSDQVGEIIAGDSREDYLDKAQKFLNHIQRGDIYEANFCTQFTASQVDFNSLQAFQDLNAISEPPFSAYVRSGDLRVVSASPERYLKKDVRTLISQPIKGTARRSSDPLEDDLLKEQLYKDPKERSENVMIVDLVRNDLSKTAAQGSVQVTELYGMYSFKQVHHMISTITSQLAPQFSGIDAIKSTFPMGSMTGAPKVSAMNIIEQTENFKRGLYSGAIGYFTPQGDFDFNVVIRTILYNKQNKNLSFAVGSAITIAAKPDKEYEECLLKARALFQVLEQQGIRFNAAVTSPSI